MKKMLLAIFAAGLMSSSLIAAVGTVDLVQVLSDGTVKIRILKEDSTLTAITPCVGTVEANKAMLAIALTAKTSGSTVKTIYGNSGWESIMLMTK